MAGEAARYTSIALALIVLIIFTVVLYDLLNKYKERCNQKNKDGKRNCNNNYSWGWTIFFLLLLLILFFVLLWSARNCNWGGTIFFVILIILAVICWLWNCWSCDDDKDRSRKGGHKGGNYSDSD